MVCVNSLLKGDAYGEDARRQKEPLCGRIFIIV
jgi:hypothetical protein